MTFLAVEKKMRRGVDNSSKLSKKRYIYQEGGPENAFAVFCFR